MGDRGSSPFHGGNDGYLDKVLDGLTPRVGKWVHEKYDWVWIIEIFI